MKISSSALKVLFVGVVLVLLSATLFLQLTTFNYLAGQSQEVGVIVPTPVVTEVPATPSAMPTTVIKKPAIILKSVSPVPTQ